MKQTSILSRGDAWNYLIRANCVAQSQANYSTMNGLCFVERAKPVVQNDKCHRISYDICVAAHVAAIRMMTWVDVHSLTRSLYRAPPRLPENICLLDGIVDGN